MVESSLPVPTAIYVDGLPLPLQQLELLTSLRIETAVNLVGRTTLWTLGALVEGAERVVCNDTGVSHVAAALGTPSVVVASGSDVARWAPLDRARHRVLWQPMPCRPCAHAVCPYEHGCARGIDVPQVLEAIDARAAARPTTGDLLHG